mmetsp:Transcript_68411/g.216499  ORF Transcript_68411/g.216499 Transcript_68411/m.216499 type:complete len:250 (+) Transcript_68411:1-750(+)
MASGVASGVSPGVMSAARCRRTRAGRAVERVSERRPARTCKDATRPLSSPAEPSCCRPARSLHMNATTEAPQRTMSSGSAARRWARSGTASSGSTSPRAPDTTTARRASSSRARALVKAVAARRRRDVVFPLAAMMDHVGSIPLPGWTQLMLRSTRHPDGPAPSCSYIPHHLPAPSRARLRRALLRGGPAADMASRASFSQRSSCKHPSASPITPRCLSSSTVSAPSRTALDSSTTAPGPRRASNADLS